MSPEEATVLLDQLGLLTHPCDLDLLIFFGRHPRCLLPSDSLAAYLGYEPKVIADSLETLLAAGLVSRLQTAAHAARLYEWATPADERVGSPLESLLSAARTRPGRLLLRKALLERASRGAQAGAAPARASKPGPRRLQSEPTHTVRAKTG